MKHTRKRVLVVVLAVGAGVVGAIPTHAGRGRDAATEQACVSTRSTTLFASPKGKDKIGYGLVRGEPSIPGPTIEMAEGDCLEITLVNDTKKRLSLHPHGVAYTVASDGSPLNEGCIAPGRQRTYVWHAVAQRARQDGTIEPGSAGYWHYHDHCREGSHGTVGIGKGLFGALVVRRPEDPRPDRGPYVLVMKDISFNLKRAPNTPTVEANLGERVEFVVITHGDLFHTFHLHGHRWADNRTGLLSGPADSSPVIDNRTQGPGDSFGFQVVAGEGVGPGAWMYHCHVQGHADGGMAGIFLVRDENGRVTVGARRALRAWRHSQHVTH
ncbi:MAG: multicopper oxidase domain-containing protein [Actinomycetota bacterium]|nr:multicopper oxidase domain-containing protein [Actinomycetota bacterium]